MWVIVLNDGVEERRFTRVCVPNYEAVEHESVSLIALSDYVSCSEFDRIDHITHLSADKACVDKELECSSRIFAKCFLPKSNPKLI